MSSTRFSLSSTGGTGNGSVRLTTLSENTTTSDRRSTVTVTNGVSSRSCQAIQHGIPSISVYGGGDPIVVQTGGTVLYSVVSHYPFAFTNIPNWITVSDTWHNTYSEGEVIPTARTLGNQFIFTCAENNTGEDRTSNIVMTHFLNGVEQTNYKGYVQIQQTGEIDYNIYLVPDSLSYPQSGGSVNVNIVCAAPWIITNNDNWLTVSRNAGTGNTQITVSATENVDVNGRTARITAATANESAVLTVSQEGGGELTFTITKAGIVSWLTTTLTLQTTIQYKLNNNDWTDITSSLSGTRIMVQVGDRLKFRGNNATYASAPYYHNYFGGTAKWNISGYLTSLLTYSNYSTYSSISSQYCFYGLFKDCLGVVDASSMILPSQYISYGCYSSMFEGCSNMISAPAELPSTVGLERACYERMFYNCVGIENSPNIKAQVLPSFACQEMFYGCSNLRYIKCLARSMEAYATDNWVYGVQEYGTFEQYSGTYWERGASGIPTNWDTVPSYY